MRYAQYAFYGYKNTCHEMCRLICKLAGACLGADLQPLMAWEFASFCSKVGFTNRNSVVEKMVMDKPYMSMMLLES